MKAGLISYYIGNFFTSYHQVNDDGHCHNQFRNQIVSRINETTGAPNASVSLLIGMMVLKEAFGWSDSQLF